MKNRKNIPKKGQSLVEMALLVPILLLLLSGILDLGRLYYVFVVVTDAAGEGAVYGASYPTDTAGIQARAAEATQGLVTLDTSNVTVTCATCPNPQSGDEIAVTVEYDFVTLTPFIGAIVPNGVIPLTATSTEVILGGQP